MPDYSDGLTFTPRLDLAPMRGDALQAMQLGERFGRSLTRAFEDAAFRGKKLEEVFGSLALSLSKLALRAAVKPLESAVGSLFSTLFSGFTPFAKGGVVTPFAGGGILSAPALFPLQRGVGLAGEAGAEAILPLARGQDGRLGVKADGGRASVIVNFNVTASDAESFVRSQSQIASMLSKAVSRGNRNL